MVYSPCPIVSGTPTFVIRGRTVKWGAYKRVRTAKNGNVQYVTRDGFLFWKSEGLDKFLKTSKFGRQLQVDAWRGAMRQSKKGSDKERKFAKLIAETPRFRAGIKTSIRRHGVTQAEQKERVIQFIIEYERAVARGPSARRPKYPSP